MVYDSAAAIKAYTDAGYVLVSDGYATAGDASKIFDTVADSTSKVSQTFDIHLTHSTTTYTPTTPGTAVGTTATDLTHAVTVTNIFGDPVNTQTTEPSIMFYRTATVDNVTGEVTPGTWTTNATGVTAGTDDQSKSLTVLPMNGRKTPGGYSAKVTTTIDGTAVADTSIVTAANTAVVRHIDYTDIMIHVQYVDVDDNNKVVGTISTVGTSFSTRSTDFTTLVTDPETNNELFALEVVQTPTALKAENGSISGTENEAIETFTGAPGQTYVIEVHHAHEQLPVTTTRTINYTYADTTEGTTAAPTQTQTANWTEDIDVYKAAQDGATPADYITYTQDSAYSAVTSPVIAQFVPDVATVAAESITTSPVTTLPTNEVVPVTYTRNVFTTQHPGAYADELTKTVTETVHYISGIDGKTVADDATPSVTFTRSRTNNADGTVTYSNWTPSTQAIAAVTSPDVTDMFTVTKTVPAVNGVTPDSAPADVTVKYYNTKVTVNPHDPQGPKNPNEPVVPDDPDSPVYPAGVTATDLNKTFTETIHFVDGDGKQVTDDKVATVHYQRNATVDYSVDPANPTVSYGNWELADGQNADYPAFSIPVFTDKVYDTANTTTQGTITNGQYGAVATDPTLDATSGSYVDTVVYKSSIQNLIPNGNIPEGVTVEPLERVITETIHYIDGATGQPLAISGEQVSVTSTRGAQVNINPDAPDDKQVVYGDWSVENLVAIDVPVEVTSDADETSKTGLVIPAGTKFFTMTTNIPAQTVNGTSDDLNYDVYYYPETVTLTPDNPDSPKDPNEPLDPSNPAGPLFPASGITNEDMHQAVTETISYVDQNGNTVAPTKTITVNYQRSYTVNFNLDGTSTATPGQWTVAPGKDGAVVSSTISAVTNPVIACLITKDKSVAAYATSTTAADGTVTLASDKPVVVTYYPNSVDITPENPAGEGNNVTPTDPNDPRVYPAGVSADDLNTTATETIRYVDGMTNATLQAPTTGNTLHFVRNAHVVWNQDGSTAVTYGKWTPKTTADQQFESVTVPQVIDGKLADLKQVDAMTETFPIDVTATVYYYGDITIQPDQPVTPGTPINPDDPNSPLYPENTTSPDNPDGTGLTATDLNQTSTRTIQYLSGIDKQTSVAKTGIQTIYFNRVGHLSYNQDGSPKVTYDNWTPADLDSNIYHELNTPVVDGMFTTTESNSEITETVPTDVSETVYYYPAEYTVTPGTPVDPDDPSQVQGPLNPGDSLVPSVTGDENVPNAPEGLTSEYLTRQVTETITYVNGVTGDVLTDAAGQPLTKNVTVNMTRNAHVSYSVIDHKPAVSYDAWTPVTFDAVTSPDVDQMYTTTPVVDQMTVKTPISLHLTVNYYPTNVTVTPITPTDPSDPSVSPKNPGDQLVPTDGKHTPDDHTPVYPAGVTEADLTTTAVETINYIDSKTGEPVHESVTQTLKFYRTANVSFDKNGQGTVVYSDWLPVESDTFRAVKSPEIDGYTSNMPTVDAVTETWPVPVSLTVYYYQDYTVTPDQPVAPAASIDPGTPADGETPAKPAIPGSPEVPEGLQDQNLNATATRTIYYVDGVTGQKVASALSRRCALVDQLR
ncbi:mucin-binding protein [Secundilactobacillus odoratitofui]|uniref:mucin-binding protein n=1 Tax=Secundilactobacillus odoratitofui TaxID=480930 RepID=UPI0006D2BF46|nr:hypothetical protein [Secundilactobacillus odoratitofui]